MALVSFIAGLDVVVGGGGSVQIPALFRPFPGRPPAVLLGTNKLANVCGTASAAVQYALRIKLPWRLGLSGAAERSSVHGLGQGRGFLSPHILRPVTLVLLIAMALYTFVHKEMGLRGARDEIGNDLCSYG